MRAPTGGGSTRLGVGECGPSDASTGRSPLARSWLSKPRGRVRTWGSAADPSQLLYLCSVCARAPYDSSVTNRHDERPPYVLDEPGGNLLLDMFVLDQRLAATLKAALRNEGVAAAHYAILAQVHLGATTPGLLVERLSLPPSTLTGYLDLLEHKDYIRRARSEQDGRSVMLALSDIGDDKRRACQAVMERVVDHLDSSLNGAGPRDEIRAALGQLNLALIAVQASIDPSS